MLEQERIVPPNTVPQKVPVGFFSRKLANGKLNWTPREKDTYVVVSALRKWASWIGLQPVLITTDHKSLEDWVGGKMDTPSGPAGRRARWHETLSKFDLEVRYIPGPKMWWPTRCPASRTRPARPFRMRVSMEAWNLASK